MAKKKRLVNYSIIEDNHDAWRLLERVRSVYHKELHDAKIALAWRHRQKADQDGLLVLGRCVKVNELNKQFLGYDFVIVLNREVWDSGAFDEAKQAALLDHELCHAAPAEDKDGNPLLDADDRQVFRTRKHDIEEFHGVILRHGCYKADLERLARILLQKSKEPPLFKDQGARPEAVH